MKKNVLLLLLSSLALAGCDFNIDQFKFWESKDNNQQTPDTANTEEPSEQENTQPSENAEPEQEEPEQEEPQGEQTNPSDPEELGTYVTTISLSDDGFKAITSGQRGYQFDDESHPSHVEDLQEYCLSKLDATNMLDSISCTKCNTAPFKGVLYFCVGTGFYETDNFNEGSFKWTSKLPLHKVEINAMPYSKLDDGGSTDSQSVVWINNESHSLATESNVAPRIETFSKEFEDGTQSFEIKSTGSRVLLESIKITWKYLYVANE